LAQTVLIGMSGGVDSSVAAALLARQGYRVIGITLNVWPEGEGVAVVEREDACCALGAVEDARRVCDALDIPHYVVNFRDVFQRQVIDNFVQEYRDGRTPNPCVRCNQFIKFDALLAKAEVFGADLVATGHYARTVQLASGRWALRKAADPKKDQTYVLYVMSQERLSRTIFPLGDLLKEETRALAEELRLHVAGKPESQEICFVPTRDYRDYLRANAPDALTEGPIVDASGKTMGRHNGVAFYTVGQRRGLGIAGPQPLFVTDLRPDTNTVVVGEAGSLYATEAYAGGVNWVSIPTLEAPTRVMAKARYKAEEVRATIEPEGELVRIRFDEPQRAVTPGQSVVFYDGDVVVGGGTLERNPQAARVEETVQHGA
jgi:tRNA-uridine 2-sulfurtransferase